MSDHATIHWIFVHGANALIILLVVLVLLSVTNGWWP